jgi:hypothetical protein
MDNNNIGEKQKYQESIKLFFNDQSLLNSIIYIAIGEKDIRFIKYLDKDLLIDYMKKRK